MKIAKIFILISLLTACNYETQEPNIGPDPIVVKDYTCNSAYQNLSKLCSIDPVRNFTCCETVEPTKLGVSFNDFCSEMLEEGVDLNLPCLSRLTNCSQINVCTDSE